MLHLMPVVIQESKSGSHELPHIISATFYWTKQEKVEKIVSASWVEALQRTYSSIQIYRLPR